MKILAIETSAKAVSVAVADDKHILGYAYQNIGLTHSVTMMPLVEGMLKNAALTPQDIGCVAVANGPGSFTGLRIGVSAAKGLAWAMQLPCCGVSTLEAMAQNGKLFEGLLICAMDARRSQVYNAVFSCHNGKLSRISPDRAIGLAALKEDLSGYDCPMLVLGDGAVLCYEHLKQELPGISLAPEPLLHQNALGVAAVACEMLQQGETVSAHDLTPVYLRLSQAERERLAKGLPITIE